MRAFVALGSNLGDRRFNLDEAIRLMGSTPGVLVTAVSNFLENPAVGGPSDSPSFLNAVAELNTSLAPRPLLERLLAIELEMGRQRGEKWGPRIIDLDLIFYGDQVIRENGLTVPHPLMQERQFVTTPLAEIAPSFRHPVLGMTLKQLSLLLGEKNR